MNFKTTPVCIVILISMLSLQSMTVDSVFASPTIFHPSDTDTSYFYSSDLLVDSNTYWLGCERVTKKGQNKFRFDLDNNRKIASFEMTEINPTEKNIQIFKTELRKAFIRLASINSDSQGITIKEQLDNSALKYLYEIHRASAVVVDSSRVVGTLTVNSYIKEYCVRTGKNKWDEKKPNDSIKIKDVEIKFEEEQVVDIKVNAKKKDNDLVLFQNRIPISYSTKADVSRDKKVVKKIFLFDTQDSFRIEMGTVFNNDYRLLTNTENYSPMDQVISLSPNDNGKVILKEKVTNLLSAQVYSDLLGLNSSQPNGLIQTEVSKRVYLYRRSHAFFHRTSRNYFGFLNSVNPKLTISKIEDNNKYLIPETGDKLCVNVIDLYKYTSWQTGGDINVFYVGVPALHSVFYINSGFYIMHVPMKLPNTDDENGFGNFRDISINEDDHTFSVNMISVFPEIHWVISPHSKFLLDYNVKWYFLWNPSKDIKVTSGNCNFPDPKKDKNNSVLSLKFKASVKLNNRASGKIFFRTIYNLSPAQSSSNYIQTQIGYAFNILDRKK